MRKQTVIIDTGCANVSSVRFAVERLGYQATLSRDSDVVLGADKLFLPGVGTASEAMKNLTERGLVDLVKQVEQPLLGICLGMQMLGTYSDEGDSPVECLGHIPAPTKLMDTDGQPLPHMGWNQVATVNDHPLFDGIVAGSHFYFVHSYAMPVGDYTLAQCHYGHAFSAAINQGNYFGVQFHPERSGKVGARLIQNFLEM